MCFDLSGQLVATASADGEKTTQVLDPGRPVSGKFFLSFACRKVHCSALSSGTARVFSAETHQCLATLEGHDGEISKVSQRNLKPLVLKRSQVFPLFPLVLMSIDWSQNRKTTSVFPLEAKLSVSSSSAASSSWSKTKRFPDEPWLHELTCVEHFPLFLSFSNLFPKLIGFFSHVQLGKST